MEINLEKAEVPVPVVDEDRAINDFLQYVEDYANNANESVRELFLDSVDALEEAIEELRLERDFDRLADEEYADDDDDDLIDADEDDDDDVPYDQDRRDRYNLIFLLSLLGTVGSSLHISLSFAPLVIAFCVMLSVVG